MKKKRILIVDDEEHIGAVLGDYLNEAGFETMSAISIAGAKTALKPGALPDIILLDVSLPDGSGMGLLKSLKTFHATKHIPVIMMSAHQTLAKDHVQGLEFGADDYLNKPFDLKVMKLRIERLLSRVEIYKMDAEIPALPSAPASAPASTEESLAATLGSIYKIDQVKKVNQRRTGDMLSPASSEKDHLEIVIHPPKNPIASATKQFLKLLLQPGIFLSAWRSQPKINQGIACLVFSAFFFGLQNGLQNQSVASCVVGTSAYAVCFISLTALMAWIIQWAFGLRQRVVRFQQIWGALCLGFAPLLVSSFLGIIYVGISNGDKGDFTAGPLLVFPMQTSSSLLGMLFRRLDVFELWGVILASAGVAAVLKSKKRTIFIWSLAVWVALVFISIGLKRVFL